MSKEELFHKLTNVYLWGNIPAFDIINFKENEGKDPSFTQSCYNILFAASGDLRMLLESSESIQELIAKGKQVNVYMNDIKDMVSMRNNLILLMLTLKEEDAIDLSLALWYSSALTQNQATFIKFYIMNQEVLEKVHS